MMEQEKDCEDILVQIGAAKAGLHKAGQSILESHLRHCVMDAVNAGKGEEALKKLSAALEQFSRIDLELGAIFRWGFFYNAQYCLAVFNKKAIGAMAL